MEPSRDLDSFGGMLLMGELERIKADYANRVSRIQSRAGSEEAAREGAAKELFALHWGPTRVPIYNLLLLSTLIYSPCRSKHLAIARWLITEAEVPVDGTDLSGSTALYHAISTKPSFDTEYGQILHDAGASVNHRNRYGGTAAHEMSLIWQPQNKSLVERAADGLKWYLDHGGNIDIKDNDGMSVRFAVDSTRKLVLRGITDMAIWDVVDKEDKRRKRLGNKCCTFCGREPEGDVKLLLCSQCKSASYCAPPRKCQKQDWPRHKEACKQFKSAGQGMTYLGVNLGW
ncbi:hypothetical protein SCP_1800810 [Sparassis crispa]|uniref:MYND-type domain-containing protein n=1 Tax=Sparassis crispa TaxID=139825 RepID=A0A401H6P8_9APHY|nr:hypothetical protein SCP_1800810 [Sparassis crispa]GBE90059.1 hypothetical protein SCP_1800810 [Sparassis crispa]